MDRLIPLFLVVAAGALIAAQPDEPIVTRRPSSSGWGRAARPATGRVDDGEGHSVVAKELDAIRRRVGLYANYAVSPTGHISELRLGLAPGGTAEKMDLGFISRSANWKHSMFLWLATSTWRS